MDIKEIINKKANKKELSSAAIDFFVSNYTNGKITDYQASALLMAIKINGMTDKETFALTKAMLYSGEIVDLSDVGYCIDKHSSGGVSDTTTLAIVPICASVGVKMLKLSGRGLGFTGGTIDKLESFKGFNVDVDINSAKELVKKNNGCIISANLNLAPADKKLYALRDSTATTESIPLIASSIMSKKLASGASAIVLDVKYGNGAFMKTKKDALSLAKLMVKIGEHFGKKVDYVLGNMNQPLGYNIGNKLEAYEAIELLSGKTGNLREETLNICAKCISIAKNIPYEKAYKQAENSIKDKSALKKFMQIVKDQSGSLNLFKGLGIKPALKIYATTIGTLTKINCSRLGELVGELGATRKQITDTINYDVGIKTFHKLGDKITTGDLLFEVYAKTKQEAKKLELDFLNCYKLN